MSLGTCCESIGVWPCRPGLDMRKCMNCKVYPEKLELEIRIQKKEEDFQKQSQALRAEILKKIDSEVLYPYLSFDGTVFDRAPANVKVVVGKHTYLAESEEAAKELRNLFVDM